METGARTLARRALVGLLSASLLGLFVLPLVALFVYAGAGGIVTAARNVGFRVAIEFTLYSSAIAVGLGVLTGVPLGYVLARYRFPGRSVVSSIVLLPVAIPHLVVGLALLILFAPTGPVGRLAAALGIPIFDGLGGVVLVMLYVGGSYVVFTSELAFRSVSEGVVEAARSLGASPTEAFVTVSLPAAARGIVTGALLMWARGVSEVGGFLILAYAITPGGGWTGPPTSTASVYIDNLYGIEGLAGAASAAALLVLVALAIFLGVRWLDRSGSFPLLGGGPP